MTEEEKKEFEEFLKWKEERTKKAEISETSSESDEIIDEGKELDAGSTKVDTKNESKQFGSGPVVIAVVALICVFLVLFFILMPKGKQLESTQEMASLSAVLDSIAAQDDSTLSKNAVVEKGWEIRTETDEMTDSKNIWASITSENTVNLDFPYEMASCSITVRYMKKWGTDVLIRLSNGQIYGSEYSNENYIMARFDDEKPIKYWFNESADASSECVFIRKKQDFINHCKKAKSIKIEVPIFQGGRPIFSFKATTPLTWDK